MKVFQHFHLRGLQLAAVIYSQKGLFVERLIVGCKENHAFPLVL